MNLQRIRDASLQVTASRGDDDAIRIHRYRPFRQAVDVTAHAGHRMAVPTGDGIKVPE
ncbi:hypothetical protein [Paraburkholderia sp. BL6665CI2N2]|uniref:hypothetical protein n=1 Tax=Paraburkholderia sp. BL6665CI2N2 TaxID=1938806 RepID=UPI0014170A8C|nr:hypothetical protein [Paraburkholderia sp. BL6665CI2N2]